MTRFPYTSAGAQQAQKFAKQTGQKMSMKKGGSAKSKAKKTPKAKKAPSRRKKSPLGARRSTRNRTAAKAHNISDVSGKSY